MSNKHRNYVFTLNNPTDDDKDHLKEAMEMNKYIYMCFEDETSASGTHHLQGYVEFKSPRTISAIKKDKGFEKAHLEPRMGTKLEAITYCAKDFVRPIRYEHYLENWNSQSDKEKADNPCKPIEAFTEKEILDWSRYHVKLWRSKINEPYQVLFFEAGDFKHGLRPGTRSDINIAKEIILTGGTMYDVAMTVNSFQAVRHAQLLKTYMPQNFTTFKPKKIYWFWGPSGTGKTRMAVDMAKDIHSIWKTPAGEMEWYDGYDGQKTVIYDEFRPRKVPFATLLELFDGYPLRVKIKGGFTNFEPEEIFVTSPKSPQQYFEGEDEELYQLTRRITEIIEFKRDKSISNSVVSRSENGTEVAGNTENSFSATSEPTFSDILKIKDNRKKNSLKEQYKIIGINNINDL